MVCFSTKILSSHAPKISDLIPVGAKEVESIKNFTEQRNALADSVNRPDLICLKMD